MPIYKSWGILGKYYDSIFSYKNYSQESSKIKELISKFKKLPGNKLLDVGCATGSYIDHLKNDYYIYGIDLSNELLKVAKAKHPDITFFSKDISKLKIKQRFDVILCVFDTISYCKTYKEVEELMEVFSYHLNSGGVLIIEPFALKENIQKSQYVCEKINVDEECIQYAQSITHKGEKLTIQKQFLITNNKGITHYTDNHNLILLEGNKLKKIMSDAGFITKQIKSGITKNKDTFVGVRI
ncbi:MAG: methyltransferase domain-containing protein [Candidatus Absconditabacteria bacterium]